MVSIIEFAVYGFFAYSSLLMLIISVIKKDLPNTDLFAITRVVWLIPGVICAAFLIQMGEEITFETIITNSTSTYELANPSTGTIQVLNSTIDTARTVTIPLFNPVFITFHYLITIVLVFYIITQILTLFTVPHKMQR